MNPQLSTVCHQDIYNFPFPYKLWIAVNSATCKFIKWNIEGTQIQVYLMALDYYLHRPKSIFKIKSRSSFVTHLRAYAFELTKTEVKDAPGPIASEPELNSEPKYSEIVMHFSHVHFLRHRIDLLAKIRKINDTIPMNVTDEKPTSSMGDGGNDCDDDLCFRRIGSSSLLSRAHFKHQLILNFLSETKALEGKLKASEMKSKVRENEGHTDEDSMIELSAELFENPHDSVLYMGEEHRTAYAGFYGNCTNEQVFKFFGPFLPMYENENNDEGEKRVASLNPTGKPPSQQNGYEVTVISKEESANSTEADAQQSTPVPSALDCFPSSQNDHSTSPLEPIFTPDEEKDEDILMDEFIKFKEQSENQDLEETEIKIEQVGLTPENEENEENEDNFKNFFSQYRESLNLLYEKL